MSEAKNNTIIAYCKSCGAPMMSDTCIYCGTSTLVHKKKIYKKDEDEETFERPAIICDEITMNLSDIGMMFMYIVFGIVFGTVGFGNFFANMRGHDMMESDFIMFLMFSPFMAVGVGMFIAVFRRIYRLVKVKRKGQRLIATVLGYKTENLNKKHSNYYIELDADMPQGKRKLKYNMHTMNQPYPVGAQVELLYIGRLYYLKGLLI